MTSGNVCESVGSFRGKCIARYAAASLVNCCVLALGRAYDGLRVDQPTGIVVGHFVVDFRGLHESIGLVCRQTA